MLHDSLFVVLRCKVTHFPRDSQIICPFFIEMIGKTMFLLLFAGKSWTFQRDFVYLRTVNLKNAKKYAKE